MALAAIQLATTGIVSGLANNQAANSALAALATMFAGVTAPTSANTGLATIANVLWLDMSVTPNVVRLRDQADTVWMPIYSVDQAKKLVSARTIGTRVTAGASTTLPNNVLTTIAWDAALYNDANWWALSPNPTRVTVPAGRYLVTGTVTFSTTSAAAFGLRLLVSGSTAAALNQGMASSSGAGNQTLTINDVITSAGDYFELAAIQQTGGTLSTIGATANTFMSVTKVQ